MVNIINGKEIAAKFCEKIKLQVDLIKTKNIFPKIALINVGDDSASKIYVDKKKQLAESLGIESEIFKFNNDATINEVATIINQLNEDKKTHAILLQSPIPSHMNFREMVDLIKPEKDVDGLTTINQGRLFTNEDGVFPCTPLGIMHMINTVHDNISSMHAVVIGRSSIVGKPMAHLLLKANCSITILHSHSKNIAEISKTADILISAIGKPYYVTSDFIKENATVIDVGISRLIVNEKSKIVGDVDFENVVKKAGAISPVPNGVGPMTVAYLMSNTVKLANKN